MKTIKQLFKKIGILGVFGILLFSCHDKLEENDGQLAADDLDFTKTDNMILSLIGAYSEVYTRGWEDPLLLGVRGDDVNSGGLGDQPLFAETDLYKYDNGFWMYNQVWENFYSDLVSIINSQETIVKFKEFAKGSNIALADQYIAETKVLSGFQHLQMSRLWGKVFIITTTNVKEDIAKGIIIKNGIISYANENGIGANLL